MFGIFKISDNLLKRRAGCFKPPQGFWCLSPNIICAAKGLLLACEAHRSNVFHVCVDEHSASGDPGSIEPCGY